MLKNSKEKYHELWKISMRVEQLTGISQVLEWDQEIYMPLAGAENRSDQLKLLAGMIHDEKVGPKFSNLLFSMIHKETGRILAKELDPTQEIALKEWRRDFLIETALPTPFVEKCAKLYSQSMMAWRSSKKNSDFRSFAPFLKKIVEANKKKADYIGYKEHPYDALIDLYEPGMTTKNITTLFSGVRKHMIALLKKIGKKPQINDTKLRAAIPEELQLIFTKGLLKTIGYPFASGRIDVSTHPFSTGNHPKDSRITTRVDPTNIFSCISSALHEAGHSFYTMGLPIRQYGTPLGQPISMGIHESQSRFWETRIGLSLPFIKYLLPQLKKDLSPHFRGLTAEGCYRAINIVNPSCIRVEADEVTYPLHVILRFEIEKGLIEGSLKVEDLPDIWNQKMKELLGVTPSNDAEGCLQDIHWSIGAIGYFPTYVLGNLFAASIFNRFAKDHPEWDKKVASGEFEFIKEFLHEHVYKYGRLFRSIPLIKNISHEPFSATPYIDYLNDKYAEIYKF